VVEIKKKKEIRKKGSDCKIFERLFILGETWARVTWENDLLLIIDFQ
jgi:hypothetical protein